MEFDKSKILTCVTADQAKVGDVGWFGDSVDELRLAITSEMEKPSELKLIDSDSCQYRFSDGPEDYSLFYPASYEYLQAKWVEENGLKVGDKVRTTRAWEEGEGGFGYSTTVAREVAYKVVNIRKDYIMGAIQAHLFYLPYFAIEKVKEPEYRPFASAEEFAPHRYGCWITRREGTYQRMLVTEYNSSGIRVGKSYISYKELVKDYIFVDTGNPAGVKV